MKNVSMAVLKSLIAKLRPRPQAPRQRQAGFTMMEVMMAMMLAMVGLMGTVAVQQTLLTATANAQDGAIALRLAGQAMEEFNSRVVQPGSPAIDRMAVVATGQWSNPVWLEATGRPAVAQSPVARWRRRVRVIDLGANQPYNISVEVQYALDTGNPKIIQLDLEKVK
jgi:prepilin-type N-terminal cleavage/methylation domain-containing protein